MVLPLSCGALPFLVEDGIPRVLCAGDGPGEFGACTRTWNQAIPLEA